MLKHDPTKKFISNYDMYIVNDNYVKAIMWKVMKWISIFLAVFGGIGLFKKEFLSVWIWLGYEVIHMLVGGWLLNFDKLDTIWRYKKTLLKKYSLEEILSDKKRKCQFDLLGKYKNDGDIQINVNGMDLVVSNEEALMIIEFEDSKGKIEDPYWLKEGNVIDNPYVKGQEIWNSELEKGNMYPKVYLCVMNGKESKKEYTVNNSQVYVCEGNVDIPKGKKKEIGEINIHFGKSMYVIRKDTCLKIDGDRVYQKDSRYPLWVYIGNGYEKSKDDIVTYDEMKVYDHLS